MIRCSHSHLIKIRFQDSNGMDPRLLVIILFYHFFSRESDIPCLFIKRYLFLFIVVHQIHIFKQGWARTCTNVKEHFDNILTVLLEKVICASLPCCAIFVDVPLAPSFYLHELEDLPINFENFLQGLVHRKVCIQSL